MAKRNILEIGKRFGEGQPTNLGGRKKKLPFIDTLQEIIEKDGKIEFHPSVVKLLPNGNYQVQLPTEKMLATKLIQMAMKGDARFMDMYMKLFGEYQAEKHDIRMQEFPLQGIDFDRLTDEQLKVMEEIGRNGKQTN